MSKAKWWVGSVFLMVATASLARADDASDVKAVARAFGQAVQQRDSDQMRSVVSANSRPFIEAVIRIIAATKTLNDASQAKFNEKMREASPIGAQDYQALESANVTVNGDSATLTPSSGNASNGLAFKREADGWKLDVAARMRDPQKAVRFLNAQSDAAAPIASEISDGKYANINEAKRAFADRVGDLLSRSTQ